MAIPIAFKKFVEDYCPSYSLESAQALAQEGKELATGVLEDSLNLTTAEKTQKIAPFFWFLMHRVVEENGKGFFEGMVVFQDPNHKLLKFFQPSAYRRWSSHYHGRTPLSKKLRFNTHAIDVPQDGKKGLPANKRTVIFSELKMLTQGEWTMIKAEDQGVSLINVKVTTLHTIHWFTRVALPRLLPSYCGTHDAPGHRDEYPEPSLVQKFKHLLEEIPHPDPEALRKVKTFGAAFIHQAIPHFNQHLVELHDDIEKLKGIAELSPKLEELRRKIGALYQKLADLSFHLADYHPLAKGKEVILEKLMPAAPAAAV